MATKKKSISVSSKKKAGGPAAKKGASRKKAAGPVAAGKKSSKKSSKKAAHTSDMRESSLTSGSVFDSREELSPFESRDVAPPAFSTPQASGEAEGKQGSMPIIALVMGAIVILVAVYVARDIFFPPKPMEPIEKVMDQDMSVAPSEQAKPEAEKPASEEKPAMEAEKPAMEVKAPEKPETTAPAAPTSATKDYTVKKGDNLYSVARAQAGNASPATLKKIKELNGMTSNALKVGQVLKIPVK